MSYKYTYPSIEYVLATGHYPEPCRKSARHHPTFFPAPPVQVFHVAYGHVPVFIPLPPATYGYPTHTRRHSHAGAYWPRNRCFTVTVPSSVANKNLLSRTTSSESIATPLEPSSPTAMGEPVMTMNTTTTLADAASFETTPFDTFAAVDDRDTRSGESIDERVDTSPSSDELSESSINKSDVETMPLPPRNQGVIAGEEIRLQDAPQGQEQVVSQDEEKQKSIDSKENARILINKPQFRAFSNSSAHNTTNSAVAESSKKFADRQHIPRTMPVVVRRRRGIQIWA